MPHWHFRLGLAADEIGVQTKARTMAKSYMPLKPDKFAIRFYAVVGWRAMYVHSMWHEGSGNTLPSSAVQRYTQLCQPLKNTLARPYADIEPTAATVLWVVTIAHQTQLYPSKSDRRIIISDNFYTRHALTKSVFQMTDGETRMLEIVHQDWIGR